jgi:hypothetical protein
MSMGAIPLEYFRELAEALQERQDLTGRDE